MGLKEQIENINHLANCACSLYVTYWALLKYSLCDGIYVKPI